MGRDLNRIRSRVAQNILLITVVNILCVISSSVSFLNDRNVGFFLTAIFPEIFFFRHKYLANHSTREAIFDEYSSHCVQSDLESIAREYSFRSGCEAFSCVPPYTNKYKAVKVDILFLS